MLNVDNNYFLNAITSFLNKTPIIFEVILKLAVLSIFQLLLFTHANAEIRVGMTTPLSGSLQAVGKNVLAGIAAYFNKINLEGGINGQQIHLIVEDDGYEPRLAAPNMRRLIEKHNVVAVIGNVGTPTAIVTVPIAIEKGVPFIGAITGAPLLRKTPPNRYVFNYRASYSEEVANMVNGLLKAGIKPKEIALFTQRDGYGDAGYEGMISALKNNGYLDTHSIAHGRYTRNSLMAGGYAPSAKFIKLAKQDLPECLFLNLSFVGSIALLNELENETDNVIITEVVPSFNSELQVAQEYRNDLKKFIPDAELSFISFEGYIIAKIFTEALKAIPGEISRESLVDSLHKLNDLNIGLGLNISYSKENHQAIHKIWPMIIEDKDFVPIDWEALGKKLNTSIAQKME